VGGIIGLFGCFPIVHLVVGIAVANGALAKTTRQPGLDLVFGLLFVGVATLIILAGWSLAAAVVLAGKSLARHKHYTFCLVVAALECSFLPFGTVLGVFTIIVLVRPSVKQLFDQESGSPV